MTRLEIINHIADTYCDRFNTCESKHLIKNDLLYTLDLIYSKDENFLELFDEIFEREIKKHEDWLVYYWTDFGWREYKATTITPSSR